MQLISYTVPPLNRILSRRRPLRVLLRPCLSTVCLRSRRHRLLPPDLHLLPVMVSVAPRQPLTRRRPPSLPGDVVPLLGRPMTGAGRAYGPGRELMLCTRHKKSLLLVSSSIRLFDGSVNCTVGFSPHPAIRLSEVRSFPSGFAS
jgi:hypothetical protein